MIAHLVKFTTEDALGVFRDAGLRVLEASEWVEDDYENRPTQNRVVKKWKVENPHTGEMEDLESAFRRYLAGRISRLFLEAEKLEIYNLFNKKT